MKRELKSTIINDRPILGLYHKDSLIFEVKSGSVPSNMVTKAIDLESRTATGIFSVYGVIDDKKDRIHPGAFTKTIDERVNKSGRVRVLWNHDQMQPPIATLLSARSLTRDELPGEILSAFPEATGGVEAKRQYHRFELAEAVWQNIQTNGLNEMSFGFLPVTSSYTKSGDDAGIVNAIRELFEIKMFEISDVHWGSSPASLAVRCGEAPTMDLHSRINTWFNFLEEIKSDNTLLLSQKDKLREGYKILGNLLETAEVAQDVSVAVPDDTNNQYTTSASSHSLDLARVANLILSLG